MLNPWSLIHCLCFSISSLQFSSPYFIILQMSSNVIKMQLKNLKNFGTYHSSLAFLVSGQAQHALHFGFSPVPSLTFSTDFVGVCCGAELLLPIV